MNNNIKLFLAIIVYMSLNLLIGDVIKNLKTLYDNHIEESTNPFCKRLNTPDANNIVDEYLEIEMNDYFRECDNFQALDFVVIQDVICNQSSKNSICNSFSSVFFFLYLSLYSVIMVFA